jgi:nucleoside triphosphatase
VGDTADPAASPARVIVVGILRNERGDYLLCRMPRDRGVFPGEWGLPGGGVEAGETLEQALRREIREELGLELAELVPLHFAEATYPKLFADGDQRDVHMIFLLFECRAQAGEPCLSAEFDAAEWVPRDALGSYALNRATRATFAKLGLLPPPEPEARPARVAPGRVAPTD